MLRLRRLHLFSLRCGLFRTMSSDPLLDEIRNCATEDHVFDLIGKNKAKLSVKHVGCAMSTLWRFQKEKPKLLRNVGQIRSHPEFLTLRILAENKIDFMDDDALVDMLYSVLRFQVVAHDSLVQQLVIEGSQRIQRLESGVLLIMDEISPHQAVAVVNTMEEIESRNPLLIQKIAVVLLKHLDSYRPIELARITQSLVLLHCQNPELYTHLRKALTRYLRVSCVPSDVSMLVRVLSMLPSSRVDEAVISNVHAVLPQSSLSDLNSVATAIIKWVRNHHPLRHSTIGEYGKLLQQLNSCAHDRVKKMDNIDLLLEELKYVSGDWLEEILLKETLVTFQRLIDQISWTNVVDISLFLTRTNCLCIPLLDRMASVTLQHIDKIHYSAMYAILLTFSVLNYEPPQGDEFFETCIQHFTPYLSSFDPHLLVLLGYSLAVAEYFPEALTKEIFNIEFLAKLDAQLETMPASLNMKIRLRLMELNRAICLECPEFQIPWFHDRFCQQQLHQGNGSLSALQHQVHHLLGELLGGVHYARVAVMTPYYYTIDFECILDKHRKPLPYANRNMLLSDLVKMNWGPDSRSVDKKDLAPDAQRVALEFLDSKAFCKNSTNLKGEYIMKKRHLEILGYHVVQIPLFEWNSMELSTKDAWMEYLRKNIFAEDINS